MTADGRSDPAAGRRFQSGARACVVGAGGGVGGALVRRLAADDRFRDVLALSRSGESPPGARSRRVDILVDDELARAFESEGPFDLVIVATGVLHADGFGPEKTWRRIDADAMRRVLEVNTIGPALVAKHALDRLCEDRPSAFAALSARVGSISDNRAGGWHSYRASKAALNMLVKCFAIELARRNPAAIAVGLHPGTVDTTLSEATAELRAAGFEIAVRLHPGTVDTTLSAPFQKNVPDRKLFTPDYSAERLVSVLDGLGEEASGRCFAWDGAEVPA